MTVAVYQWRAWDGFLLPAIFPDAIPIPAQIGESAEDVFGRIPAAATLFCFHLDLTFTHRVPTDRDTLIQQLTARGIDLVNGHLTDISKRRVQSCCLQSGFPSVAAEREGDPDEWLIVKTDLNYGGHPERNLAMDERRITGLSDAYPQSSRRQYPVVRRRDVVGEAWLRRDVVVERFVSNARECFVRSYVLLDRLVVVAAIVAGSVKELSWGIPRQEFYFDRGVEVRHEAPDYDLSDAFTAKDVTGNVSRLRRFCDALHLDFGALDVVIDDCGEWYVVDANATPFWNRPDLQHIVRFLAGARHRNAN